MSLESLTEAVRATARAKPDFPYCVLLRVTDYGHIRWDGTATPPAISNEDGPAEAVIGLEAGTLEAILAGRLDPSEAWMDGLFEVEGSTAAAIALGQLFLPDGPEG